MTKKGLFFVLLAMAIVVFTSNPSLSANLDKTLKKGSPWLMIMETTQNHGLVEFKRGVQYVDGEKEFDYVVKGTVFTAKFKGGSVSFNLEKSGDSVLAYNRKSKRHVFTLKPTPLGYEDFVDARKEENVSKRMVLANKLASKRIDPFVKSQVAKLLFEGGSYLSALTLYQGLGDKTGIAACNILQTVTSGVVPKGADIISSARVFWDKCVTGKALGFSGFKDAYRNGEAVAYACAVAGRMKQAEEYQAILYRQIQRDLIVHSGEIKKANIDMGKINHVLLQYRSGKKPASFRPSST